MVLHSSGRTAIRGAATLINWSLPEQFFPPCCGSGRSQCLFFFMVPPPQVTLHWVYVFHSLQPPSTMKFIYIILNKGIYTYYVNWDTFWMGATHSLKLTTSCAAGWGWRRWRCSCCLYKLRVINFIYWLATIVIYIFIILLSTGLPY